jgi:hypothetical protein
MDAITAAYAAGGVAVAAWVARSAYREGCEQFGASDASRGACLLLGFSVGLAWPLLAPFVLAWLAYRVVRGVVFWRV